MAHLTSEQRYTIASMKANGFSRKVKTKTLERRPSLYGGPNEDRGKPTTTISKEKTKSPGSKTTRKTASETVKGAKFISGRPMPEKTTSLSYKEGKKRTKFNK